MWTAEPLVILSRIEKGVDFGVKRRVVAIDGDKILFWRPGHTAWVSRGQSGYHPGALMLMSHEIPYGQRIAEGGRLDRTLKNDVILHKIASFFGCECSDLPALNTKTTFRKKI